MAHGCAEKLETNKRIFVWRGRKENVSIFTTRFTKFLRKRVEIHNISQKSQVKISKILMKVCGNSQHFLQNSCKIVWKFTSLLSKFLQNHMEIHNRSQKILLKNAQKFTIPIRKFFQIGIEIHTSQKKFKELCGSSQHFRNVYKSVWISTTLLAVILIAATWLLIKTGVMLSKVSLKKLLQ